MLRRLSCYFKQNVIAFIALFFALAGGTAYALDGTNTVFNDDIVDDQVTTADVRDDTLAFGGLYAQDLGPGSVGTSEVANFSLGNGDFLAGSVDSRVLTDNSVTSADVQLSTLQGADVAANTLTGADIDESSLSLPPTTTATFAGPPNLRALEPASASRRSSARTCRRGAMRSPRRRTCTPIRSSPSRRGVTVCELRNGSGYIGGATDERWYRGCPRSGRCR